MMCGGKWVASLWLSDNEPRVWSPADIRVLENISERTWLAVEKIQNESALRESEERRKLAQEAGNVGIWDWDIAAGRTYWSETMWAFYGEKQTDINPDEEFWSRHLHPNDRERVKRHLRGAVESNEDRYHDEFRVVTKHGAVRWVEALAKITRDESGNARRMYGVNLDITDRKGAEERIRLSEYQLRLVTNAVPALIYYVDASETFRFVNHAFTGWFDLTPDEFIGKTVQEVFGFQAYRIIQPRSAEALSGREVVFEALLNFRKVGQRFVHSSYVPNVGPDGRSSGILG